MIGTLYSNYSKCVRPPIEHFYPEDGSTLHDKQVARQANTNSSCVVLPVDIHTCVVCLFMCLFVFLLLPYYGE